MPETPVNEHGHPATGKNKIGLSRQFLDMKAVPKSKTMCRPPHSHFRRCILSLNPRHALTALFRREGVSHLAKTLTLLSAGHRVAS